MHALRRRLVSKLPAVRTKNVARADEDRNRREVFQAPVHRTHQITLRIDITRVNLTTILQPFDSEKRIDLIKLRNLGIRQRRIEPRRQQNDAARLLETIFAKSLCECQTDPAA